MSCRTLIPLLLVCWLPLTLVGCGGAAPAVRTQQGPPTPDQLYPLAEGNAWSYDVDTGDGDTVLAVARVAAVRGRAVEVLSGGGEVLRYERRADGIYRPHRGGYLLKAPIAEGNQWDSGAGVTAKIVKIAPLTRTTAGDFEGCVEVAESGFASGQRVLTIYCPGVGPVLVVSEMDIRGRTLRVVARLRGYQTVPSGSK